MCSAPRRGNPQVLRLECRETGPETPSHWRGPPSTREIRFRPEDKAGLGPARARFGSGRPGSAGERARAASGHLHDKARRRWERPSGARPRPQLPR